MATVTSEKQPIPKVILRKLNRMRSQLTRWIMVHGLGRWLLAVLLVLAADMLLDRAFKMDMAQRLVMLVIMACLLYTSPSPRDQRGSRMPSSA